jgi:hypothetical protein
MEAVIYILLHLAWITLQKIVDFPAWEISEDAG